MLPKLFSTLPLTTYRLRKELMQRLGLEIHESGINVQAHQIEQLECKHYDRRLPKLGPLQSCCFRTSSGESCFARNNSSCRCAGMYSSRFCIKASLLLRDIWDGSECMSSSNGECGCAV